LERIFGKKEEKREQVFSKQVFSIEDAENFLSTNFDERFKTFKEDANKIYEEMQPVVVNMQKSLNDLVRAEFREKVDSELLQNVIAHRKSFAQKMEILIEKIKKPMQFDIDSILEFNNSISSAISETDMKTVKDYHFLKILFERDAQKTFENFKILGEKSNNFESLINSNKENLFSIINAQSELKSIKEETRNLDQIEGHLKTLNIKLSDLNSKHDNLKEDLRKFKNDKDWLHFNELLDEKRIMEEKISDLKSQLLQDTFQINKPLRKFKNLVDKEVVKIDDEKILKKYVDSTLDVLIEEKNPETIRSILEMVQKNISEGKIKLKDKEKIMVEIKRILDNNLFENFLKKYLLLMQDLEKLGEDITAHKASSIKNKMESQIEDVERYIEMTRLEIEKVKKQTEKIKNSIKERKITLEKTLALLDKKEISINI
jgi:hypothetical protein